MKNKHHVEAISFEEYLHIHGSSGDEPDNIENDFQAYLKF